MGRKNRGAFNPYEFERRRQEQIKRLTEPIRQPESEKPKAKLSLEEAGRLLEQHRPMERLPPLERIEIDPYFPRITVEHVSQAGFKPMDKTAAIAIERQKLIGRAVLERSFRNIEVFAAHISGINFVQYNALRPPDSGLCGRIGTNYEVLLYRDKSSARTGPFSIFIGNWGERPEKPISTNTVISFLSGEKTRILNSRTLEQCLFSGQQFGIYQYEIRPSRNKTTVFEIVPFGV